MSAAAWGGRPAIRRSRAIELAATADRATRLAARAGSDIGGERSSPPVAGRAKGLPSCLCVEPVQVERPADLGLRAGGVPRSYGRASR